MELITNQNNISPPISGEEDINNTWKKLPKEIIKKIFSYLNDRDLSHLEIAHKWFWKFTHDPESILYRWIFTSKLLNESEIEAAKTDVNARTQLIHQYRSFDITRHYTGLLGNKLTSDEILYLPAYQGSQNALIQLVRAKRYVKDSKVQKEMLDFLKTCADRGNSVAVEALFNAYRNGWFGLNSKDKHVRDEGYQLIKMYAEQRCEKAVSCLLKIIQDGLLSFSELDKESRIKIFKTTALEAINCGSQEAAIMLLNFYRRSHDESFVDIIVNLLINSEYYLQKLLGIEAKLITLNFYSSPLFTSQTAEKKRLFEEVVTQYQKLMREEFPDLQPKNYTWGKLPFSFTSVQY